MNNPFSLTLFDRFIDCVFYNKDGMAESIKTLCTGLKPGIKFTWSRVPGQFTYKCRLEITNWFTNTAWYDYESVTVTAGYMYGRKVSQTIQCQIFNAYKPTGGPDTAAVFECIVAKAESRLLTDVSYLLNVYDVKATVYDALTVAAKKLGLTLVAQCSDSLLNAPFSRKLTEESFDSGYQVVNYFNELLNDIAAQWEEKVNIVIFNTYLAILHFTKDNAVYPSKEQKASLDMIAIPVIDRTTDVTWTAGTLSITAPWNPEVEPGKVFYCTPSLYTGSTGLPNSVARAGTHRDAQNCYYVITQQVSFATNSSQNEMKILAVRMSNSPAAKLIASSVVKARAEQLTSDAQQELTSYIKEIETQYKQGLKQEEIKIGSKEVKEVDSVWKQTGMPGVMRETPLTTKHTLDSLAKLYYPEQLYCKLAGKPFRFPGYFVGYALIPLATYQYYLQTKLPKYYIDPQAPANLICDNTHFAMIPQLSSYSMLNKNTQVAERFEKLAEYYAQQGNLQWYQNFKNIARVVKEGTISE